MKADEKLCPRCAEPIKKAAAVCKHCGYQFSPEELAAQKAADAAANKAAGMGCLAIVGLLLLVGMCSSLTSQDDQGAGKENAAAAARDAEALENKRRGFHCLSDWDGSHRGVVDAVKTALRDPNSFEHSDTRISPVNESGNHSLVMEYRARNGFGGMNVGYVAATVKNSDCTFTITANAD